MLHLPFGMPTAWKPCERVISPITSRPRTRGSTPICRRSHQGRIVEETWTFYPGGKPVLAHCRCQGIEWSGVDTAMLVEAETINETQVPPDLHRAAEALRHAPGPVAIVGLDGRVLLRNMESLRLFGDFDNLLNDKTNEDGLAASCLLRPRREKRLACACQYCPPTAAPSDGIWWK